MMGMLPKCHKRLVPVHLDLRPKSVFLSQYAVLRFSFPLQLTREQIDCPFSAFI
jgi:hypothetical protein